MPLMDEFREEREAIKHGTLKQKLSYFFDYYKWHVVITAAVIGIVISLVVNIINRKETALYVCMLNTLSLDAEGYAAGFAEFADIDLGKYDLIFDTNLSIQEGELDQTSVATAQKLLVYIAAGQVDLMITDNETLRMYTANGYFYDLREFLTPEQLERYEPYFYYVDMKVVEERREAMDRADDSYVPSYPDPRKPEEMERPIPVGLYLDDSKNFRNTFFFMTDDVVLAVLENTAQPETVRQFIDYVMVEP